jgi:hypothetical protein
MENLVKNQLLKLYYHENASIPSMNRIKGKYDIPLYLVLKKELLPVTFVHPHSYPYLSWSENT